MTLKSAIKQGFRILANPEKEFSKLDKRTLESVLEDYIKLILFAGLLAGIFSFVYAFFRAGYFHFFKGITVNYLDLAGYYVGISTGYFFFYIFGGTFILFVISLFVKLFARGIKYAKLVQLLFYAMTPVLFFSWLSDKLVIPLLVWSLFILIVGIRYYNKK